MVMTQEPGTAEQTLSSASNLDDLGVRLGSRLSSLDLNCLRDWERLLPPASAEPFGLLEIGLGDSVSLPVWREWYPAARITGLYPRRVSLDPVLPGCEITVGRQTDLLTLRDLLERQSIKIVIDDANRRPAARLVTFFNLFPWLTDGAVYCFAGLDEPAPPGGADFDGEAFFGPIEEFIARLGKMTVIRERAGGVPLERALTDAALRRMSGVHLFRGSAVITG